jgi:tRNA(Ile)-lysidine synthase
MPDIAPDHPVIDGVRVALGEITEARYCVALSGGMDSSVLVQAMAGLVAPDALRAVYVDHGLHPDSGAWANHCRGLCERLGVRFEVRTVRIEPRSGESLEAAARRERYAALLQTLRPGEALLTAHHEDDQAETVLLNLLRGCGISGLAGVPRRAQADGIRLLRPLLGVSRAEIEAYARVTGLAWIEDPSNTDIRMDRNFLRHQVIPVLESRWQGLRRTIGRSARLHAEAAMLLDELAARDAHRVGRGPRLSLDALSQLPEPRQRNLLRWVCRRQLGSVPGEARLREGLAQLLAAGPDRSPLIDWPGGEVRRYRGRLFVLAPSARAALPGAAVLRARPGACLDLGRLGRLRLRRVVGSGLATARITTDLDVRMRAGGERLRPAGRIARRQLKKLLQERGIVPWMRDRLPLLYWREELVAVADLWVAAEFVAGPGEPGLEVRWEAHPPLS